MKETRERLFTRRLYRKLWETFANGLLFIGLSFFNIDLFFFRNTVAFLPLRVPLQNFLHL